MWSRDVQVLCDSYYKCWRRTWSCGRIRWNHLFRYENYQSANPAGILIDVVKIFLHFSMLFRRRNINVDISTVFIWRRKSVEKSTSKFRRWFNVEISTCPLWGLWLSFCVVVDCQFCRGCCADMRWTYLETKAESTNKISRLIHIQAEWSSKLWKIIVMIVI